MKKIVILFILLILVMTGVFVFESLQKKQKPPAAPPPIPITTIAPISAPRTIDFPSTRITFVYDGPLLALPDQLPAYSLSYPPNLPTAAVSMANKLGFTVAPTQPVNYIYDWIDTKKQFSYDDKEKTVSFSFFSVPADPSTLPSFAAQEVILALSSSGFLSDTLSLVESDRQTVPEGAEGGQENQPPLAIINYRARIKNQQYPFIFTGAIDTTGQIRTTASGRVVSFSFSITPQIKQGQDRQLLSVNQVIDELNNQKGYLAAVAEAVTTYPTETSVSFSEVQISSISVAYFLMPQESLFLPIYVIDGVGLGGTKPRTVRYYLRASS